MKSGKRERGKRHIAKPEMIFIDGFNVTMSQCGVKH